MGRVLNASTHWKSFLGGQILIEFSLGEGFGGAKGELSFQIERKPKQKKVAQHLYLAS